MSAYRESAQQALQSQNSSSSGLSSGEASARLAKVGKNRLQEGKKKSNAARFFDQLKDPMIIVLLGAALLSGVFGEYVDVLIILVVVLLNACLGVYQESKAEKALEALQRMAAPHSRVRRDGVLCQIASEDIVPGDIVLLEAGDTIPADVRILESASLKVEEAALTGESVAVEKHSNEIAAEGDVPLGDRVNMGYMGTNVVYGRGEGVAVGTGMDTEMGKIAGILADTVEEKTPLQNKLASLSRILSICVLGICAVVFLTSILRSGDFSGENILDALMTAVSLAVAAIPEGLVVVVTVLLSLGVTRMSQRNSIIRRLTAVETLGCTQVICSDKTGTLTQNRMTVVEPFGDAVLLPQGMALCNDVEKNADGEWAGEPTEAALVRYALDVGADKAVLLKATPRADEIPFDSNRKMMTTLHRQEKGFRQYTKGAPDEILSRCAFIREDGKNLPMTQAHLKRILSVNHDMAGKALRVLALAMREYENQPDALTSESAEKDMVFIGLTGMIDPIRPEVKDAIAECKSAGIRAIMITGDHKDTAVAIAKELGILSDENQAVTGAELSMMSDAEFEKRISALSVYARVQPEHKVRIVNMWKKMGKITAMTGDGVNDAPALKSADIGVGMGITGTDVTKNVADMVLADDNFASIVYAVEEGRRIYENIRKAIQFLLASNLSEVVAIFAATLVGWRLFAPIHILWINLVTDTLPAMALGMEPAEPDAMQKPPREATQGIFSDRLGADVIYQGVIVAVLTLLSFIIGRAHDHLTGMTMAFLTLSMCEIFHSLNMRSRHKSIFSMKTHNKYLFAAMAAAFLLTVAVIYIPGLNTAFQLTALPLVSFLAAFGLAFAIIPIVEIVKAIQRAIKK